MAENREMERSCSDPFRPFNRCTKQRPADAHAAVFTANHQAEMHVAFEPPRSDESGDMILDRRYDNRPVGYAEIYQEVVRIIFLSWSPRNPSILGDRFICDK